MHVYDAAYVVLVQMVGVWLHMGDRKLYNALSSALPWVKWIGDYRLTDVPPIE